MIDLNDVLLAMSNIPVDDPIAEIWGRQMQGGYKIIEYTGSLPITINANGDALIDYRIYGASGGVGERTENLFDIREVNNPPKCTYSGNTFTLENQGINYDIMCKTNGAGASPLPEKMIAVSPGTYTLMFGNVTAAPNSRISVRFFDGETVATPVNQAIIHSSIHYTLVIEKNGYISFMLNLGNVTISDLMLVKSSTAPASYIPYGYKLPMTVSANYEYVFTGNESFNGSYNRYRFRLPKTAITTSNASNTSCNYFPYGTGLSRSGTFSFEAGAFAYFGVINEYPTISDFKQFLIDQYNAGTPMTLRYFLAPSYFPVYIGENQLGEDEYVSFSEQKIYKDVSGTLTPTDPPVSFPDIPTIKGETVIDYDGEPKPSQMYVKYKDEGGQ